MKQLRPFKSLSITKGGRGVLFTGTWKNQLTTTWTAGISADITLTLTENSTMDCWWSTRCRAKDINRSGGRTLITTIKPTVTTFTRTHYASRTMNARQAAHVKWQILSITQASVFHTDRSWLAMISTSDCTALQAKSASTRNVATSKSDIGASRTLTASRSTVHRLDLANMTKNAKDLTLLTRYCYQSANDRTHFENLNQMTKAVHLKTISHQQTPKIEYQEAHGTTT